MNDDRRLRPRYAVAVPIDVKGVRGLTRNLSINAVIFTIPGSLEVGDEIRFSIYMGAGECRLDCHGRVISQRPLPDNTYDTGASIDRFEMHFADAVGCRL